MKTIVQPLGFINRPDGEVSTSLLGFTYKITRSKVDTGSILTISKGNYTHEVGAETIGEAVSKANDHNQAQVMELFISMPKRKRTPSKPRVRSVMPLTERLRRMEVGDIEYIAHRPNAQGTVFTAASTLTPNKYSTATVTGLDRDDNVFKIVKIERVV